MNIAEILDLMGFSKRALDILEQLESDFVDKKDYLYANYLNNLCWCFNKIERKRKSHRIL